MKTELDEQTAELNETRGVEIEMRNKLEENQKIMAENQKRLKYWHEKLSKLTIQNIGYDDPLHHSYFRADRKTVKMEKRWSLSLSQNYLETS